MQAESEQDDHISVATQPREEFHSLFSSPDGDIILGSKDGILFRVHSFTLKTTSGWFRAMYTLPQHTTGTTAVTAQSTETIYVDEDSKTLEGLLRMICGLAIPRLDSYDTVESILHAAEKYDMPGPMSIVRALLGTLPLLSDPLRLYAISCRYSWHEEAMMASRATLTLNVHATEHRPTLQKLGTDALLSLFALHHTRREALRHRLDEPPFVNDSGDTSCSNCGSLVDYHTWRELKYVITMEMDVRPLGDTICNPGLLEWPAARACWNAKCTTCERVLYDKTLTMRVIRECIEQLPTAIDYPHLPAQSI